jgi:hypothetical protein
MLAIRTMHAAWNLRVSWCSFFELSPPVVQKFVQSQKGQTFWTFWRSQPSHQTLVRLSPSQDRPRFGPIWAMSDSARGLTRWEKVWAFWWSQTSHQQTLIEPSARPRSDRGLRSFWTQVWLSVSAVVHNGYCHFECNLNACHAPPHKYFEQTGQQSEKTSNCTIAMPHYALTRFHVESSTRVSRRAPFQVAIANVLLFSRRERQWEHSREVWWPFKDAVVLPKGEISAFYNHFN